VAELWTIVDFVLMIAQWVIVIQAVLSWLIAFNVINTHNDAVRGLWQGLGRVTEPLYRPIRRIMPDFGALDLSPMVVLLAIILLRQLVAVQISRAYVLS
jgi:YggT family protein